MKRFIYLSFIASILFILQACENQDVSPVERIPDLDIVAKANPQKPLNFRTHLRGDQEVPPADTKATGQFILRVNKDKTAAYYKLIVANIENVRFSHIHLAPAGVNGSVVAFLYPGPTLDSPNGILAEGTLTKDDLIGPLAGQTISDLVNSIRAGNTYVNVHTDQFPGGELRGQIK